MLGIFPDKRVFILEKTKVYDRIALLYGETGENPVRARRREVQNMRIVFCKKLSLPNAADSGNTIGEIREGDLMKARSRNIHKVKSLVQS